VAALLVDLTADCLLLGLLGLGPFGGMVPSGKEAHSIADGYTESICLSRSSALIFDEAQTITANAALARSRGGKRSSAMAPTTLCIVAFTVEIMPSSLSVAAGTIALAGAFGSAPLLQFMDRFRLRTKKASLGRGGFALSVILPPALSMSAPPLRPVMSHYIAKR